MAPSVYSRRRTADETSKSPHPIAIDGPAASGKSTLARALVERFGYVLLDTGLMYRVIALAAQRAGRSRERCGRLRGAGGEAATCGWWSRGSEARASTCSART